MGRLIDLAREIHVRVTERYHEAKDLELIQKAIESCSIALHFRTENYLDPFELRWAPNQSDEWIGLCMDAQCLAQQLYAEEMGWVG